MENLRILILIIVCSLFSYLLFNGLMFYNNLDNIRYINKKYNNLANSISGDVIYIDDKISDDTSKELDVNKKWRCVYFDNKWVQLSSVGISSNSPLENNKSFLYKRECLLTLLTEPHYVVYAPCNKNINSRDCKLFKSYFNNL